MSEIYNENIALEMGVDGMNKLIKSLRIAPPRSFGGMVVRFFNDYIGGISLDLEKKYAEPLAKQGRDMILFILSDKSEVCLAPDFDGGLLNIALAVKFSAQNELDIKLDNIKKAVLELIRQYSEV